jgi:RNA polymerase sigma factor (sigma-70 family)
VGTMQTEDLSTLVQAIIGGNEEAWNELVSRFARLVAVIIRRYRLSPSDTEDVSQLVWLRLIEHVSQIREPAALPAWVATTTRHECLRCLRSNSRSVAMDPVLLSELAGVDQNDVDEALIAAERRRVLLDGLAELPPHHRELLLLLAADPPLGYAEIGEILGIPIGSIGPSRGRALDKLRETTAVRAYLDSTVETVRTGGVIHALAELE